MTVLRLEERKHDQEWRQLALEEAEAEAEAKREVGTKSEEVK